MVTWSMDKFRAILVVVIFITPIYGKRILLLGIHSHSHQIEILSVGNALAQRGHEVFNTLPENPQTHKDKSIGENDEDVGKLNILSYKVTNMDPLLQKSTEYEKTLTEMVFEDERDLFTIGHWIMDQSQKQCTAMLTDKAFLDKINLMKFDIVLVDAFILDYCLFIIPYQLSLPYIAISGTLLNYWSMGIPALPSVSPGTFFDISPKQTLFQRLFSLFEHSLINSMFFPMKSNQVIFDYAPNYYNHRERFLQEAQLFIITFDHHLEFPGPSMPDTIFLPGITYLPPEPLPPGLEEIIKQTAKSGIIFVSFGSNLSGNMPKQYFLKLLQAFRHFSDYLVLWKYPNSEIKKYHAEMPKNVYLEPWFQQNDILGHSGTKLFVTHCGNNGQYEALHNGVPMIGLPLFAEQHHNANRMKQRGYGISLDLYTMTSHNLISSMDEILHKNPEYRKKVKSLASILSYFPPPRETAANWIEQVSVHGNHHLRSPARDMGILEFLSLDIFFTVFFVISLVIYCALLTIRFSVKRVQTSLRKNKFKTN